MAAAAVAAAMANANAFTIVYPKTTKLAPKSSINVGTTKKFMENSTDSKRAKFTRRQSEYIKSSRIPALNRRNSLYNMPELEPFEEPEEGQTTVIAMENQVHAPQASARQQRLSSIISNDDETEQALGKIILFFVSSFVALLKAFSFLSLFRAALSQQ